MMDMKDSTRTVDFARLYVRMGYCCVPLWHFTPQGCGCGNPVCDCPGAHPVHTVVADATCKEEELLAILSGYPRPNVGIVTGSVSGIVAITVDLTVAGSADAWERLTTDHRVASDTMTAVGGRQKTAVFRLPNGIPILPQQLVHPELPGITLRGEGACFVAPPSVDPFTDALFRWNQIDEPVVISADVLYHFLQSQQHLNTIPLLKTKLSHDDGLIYLKGFFQHLRASGFSVTDAHQMTLMKRASLVSPPTNPEIESVLKEDGNAPEKEESDEISLD